MPKEKIPVPVFWAYRGRVVEVVMKKTERRFPVVPVEEVLKHARLLDDSNVVEKVEKKEEPYAVPARGPGQSS